MTDREANAPFDPPFAPTGEPLTPGRWNRDVVKPIRKINENFGRTGQILALVRAKGRALRFTVVSQENDTVTCTPEGGTSPADDIQIAKPPELRDPAQTTPGTRPGNVNDQEIWPPYDVGSFIWAIVADETGVTDVRFIDLNVSGRAWAEPEGAQGGFNPG